MAILTPDLEARRRLLEDERSSNVAADMIDGLEWALRNPADARSQRLLELINSSPRSAR